MLIALDWLALLVLYSVTVCVLLRVVSLLTLVLDFGVRLVVCVFTILVIAVYCLAAVCGFGLLI